MTHQISESRFYMWRAVFAMAHVDGKVSQEEEQFANQYIHEASFTEDQKSKLIEDLKTPQSVGEMLKHVTDLSDQADFFQFSHMLAWKDGDFSMQEKVLLERMSNAQMDDAEREKLAHNIRESRKAAILRRAMEDNAFEAQAKDVSGFVNVIRYIMPWMNMQTFEAPDAEMFRLWRAVFSLVHVDDDLAQEERDYIEGIMEMFHFSDIQKQIVHEDLEQAPDVLELFSALKNVRHKKQFFVMARTVIWCDGIFHEKEKEAIDRITNHLGEEAPEYSNELQWINRKPDEMMEGSNDNGQEAMIKNVVKQMISFYKEKAA